MVGISIDGLRSFCYGQPEINAHQGGHYDCY